ncbi:MAG: lamin tail domain-containing protein, partial [Verrucomicrobiota bacterium]
ALKKTLESAGLTFVFTNQVLGPGAYTVLVKDLAAFTSRYGTNGIDIAGTYSGSLANGGESIGLSGPFNVPILDFDYRDSRGWPVSVDGAGHALVPLSRADQANEELDAGDNWRAGTYRHGSPGRADPVPFVNLTINELAAHTDNLDTNNFPLHDSDDWIELFNAAATNINLGDWYLSDDPDDLKKWAIPHTNSIAPGSWISFDETTGFHDPITSGFGLNKAGESIFLSYLPGTAEDRVADAIRFKGQENDVSWGRFPDGDTNLYTTARTRDAANALTGVIPHPDVPRDFLSGALAHIANGQQWLGHDGLLSWLVETRLSPDGPAADPTAVVRAAANLQRFLAE